MSGRPLQRRYFLGGLSVLAGAAGFGGGLFGRGAAWAEDAAWEYEGATGPEHWSRLPGAAACGGQRQSPVDLAAARPIQGGELSLSFAPFTADFSHKGHTVQLTPRAEGHGNHLTLGGTRFDFLQLHFHHPSEHALAGWRWPLEMHLVHKAADGNLAVLGIMIRPGRENDGIAALVDALPAKEGASRPVTKPVELGRFVPANAATYFYPGSLTTPPCSEIVSWIVFRDPIEAGIGQIEAIAHAFPMNARPLQPDAGRRIGIDLF